MSMERNRVKVLVVDDHAIVRKGLMYILRAAAAEFDIGEAEDGDQAVRRVRDEDWDLVLLDMNMPKKNGLEALKQIRADRPDIKTLVLSMYREDYCGLRVLKAGAAGYINKSCTPEQLRTAIMQVVKGDKYVTQELADRLAGRFDPDAGILRHEALTDREFQIFGLLAMGKTVSEIAGELRLSVKTISTHRTSILSKLGLRNNADLVRYFISNGYQEHTV